MYKLWVLVWAMVSHVDIVGHGVGHGVTVMHILWVIVWAMVSHVDSVGHGSTCRYVGHGVTCRYCGPWCHM